MNPYSLDLSLSFLVGGVWVTLASLAAQRFGGRVGGFIAGLPATAVLSLFFITYTEGPVHAHEVTGIFPLTMSVTAVFLTAFAVLSRRSFLVGLSAGLALWTLAETAVFHWHPRRFDLTMALGALVFLGCYFIVGRLKIPDPGTRHVRHGVPEIGLRALAGGSIIVLSMLGSRLGGPILGGILSAFPATTAATLIITNRFGGRELTRIMPQAMMASGVISCVVFGLVYRQMVLHTHILAALATSYGVSLLSAGCIFCWMNPRPSVHQA